MGTATKNTTYKKIKDKFKNYDIDLNKEKMSEMVEDLGYQVIRFKSTKKYFSLDDFEKMMLKGVVGLSAAKTGKLKEFDAEYDDEKNNFNSENIIDKLLEEIEENEENKIFLTAFKLVMTEMLKEKKLDNSIFIENFIIKSIEAIIISESQAEFIQLYLANPKKEEEFKHEINKFSKKFVNDNLKKLIIGYNKGEKTIKDIIEKLKKIKPYPHK